MKRQINITNNEGNLSVDVNTIGQYILRIHNSDGYTALMILSEAESQDVIELLREAIQVANKRDWD